jgi:hypothetical protein
MTEPEPDPQLRAHARRVLRAARRSRVDERTRRWPLEILFGLAVVLLLVSAVWAIDQRLFG